MARLHAFEALVELACVAVERRFYKHVSLHENAVQGKLEQEDDVCNPYSVIMRPLEAHTICVLMNPELRWWYTTSLGSEGPRDISYVCTKCMARRFWTRQCFKRECESPETNRWSVSRAVWQAHDIL